MPRRATSSQGPDQEPQRRLASLQALRAAAALAVVAYHAGQAAARAQGRAPALLAQGAAGVDVFFVISGFVMVTSSRALAGQAHPARDFLAARLHRIVPLYWLCSLARLGAGLCVPALAASWPKELWFIAGSFLFLPVRDAAGLFQPVLPVGWTLSFEMLFYALFALVLALRLPPARALPPLLCAWLLCAMWVPPGARGAIGAFGLSGNPMLLEFIFGTTLAAAWARGWRLPAPGAGLLLVAAVATLCVMPKNGVGPLQPQLQALAQRLPVAPLPEASLATPLLPHTHLPNAKLPNANLPNADLPHISLPDVSLAQLTLKRPGPPQAGLPPAIPRHAGPQSSPILPASQATPLPAAEPPPAQPGLSHASLPFTGRPLPILPLSTLPLPTPSGVDHPRPGLPPLNPRFLCWGLPAAALVLACVSLERKLRALAARSAAARLLPALGDASYAIYLSHGFVLAALCALPPLRGQVLALLALGLPASAACGWLLHRLAERPLLRLLQPSRRREAEKLVLVLAGGGLSPVSGGVGTLLRGLMDAWSGHDDAPRLRVVDTRGQGGLLVAAWHFAAAAALLCRLAAQRRLLLVHAHMTTRGSAWRKAALCMLARALRCPVVLHMHGADFAEFHAGLPPLPRAVLNAALRRCGWIVVVGTAARSFLIASAGVPAARIALVPNAVRTRAPVQRQRPPAPRILFLGRLCARKGVPELIAALASPLLRDRPWHAILAGDGDAAPFRAMLNWHGLGGKVALPGWQSAARTEALLAQADMLVLPSHHEAMPIAVLEALAAGIAVIATPVGAIPEFLRHGEHALLVPPGSPAQLAEAIRLLLEDADLRERLGRAGARLIEGRLDITHAAARLAELYREAGAAGPTQELLHV